MGFASKEIGGLFKIAIYGIIGLIVGYLILNLLPVILLIALVSWGGYKLIKAVKASTSKKSGIYNNKSKADFTTVDMDNTEEYTNGQIIDVDYTEVK